MATTPNAATPADFSRSPQALLRRLRGADEIAHLITLIAAVTLLLITTCWWSIVDLLGGGAAPVRMVFSLRPPGIRLQVTLALYPSSMELW